jgi:GDSL-like lipase/acylhydrolase family protein
MGRLMTAIATMIVALAITTATASASDVPCSKLSAGKYQCSFYPAGNGISAGAPVQDATGKRVGYLNHGANWIVCQASGATVHNGADENRWWGYTEANDQHFGWVNAVWASGGSNNGPFAAAPNCGSTYGSPPAAATPAPTPAPAPTPIPTPAPTTPRPVPCHSIGAGKHQCFFYTAGDGIHGGTPVFAGSKRVGYLNHGTNWVLCQQQGAQFGVGNGTVNVWWAWTEADNHKLGWVNAVFGRGGSNNGKFEGVPSCGGAHGTPPGATKPTPTPTPRPAPQHNPYTVALGDSYSSGLGNPSYYAKAPCWQSYGAYAYQLSLDLALDITDFEACAGATTSSVLHDQVQGYHVGGLSSSTGVVTLSVGGNDADFIGILGRCLVVKSWCENQLRKERAVIRNQLPGRLDTLYAAIKHAAPNAKVIVLGYPYIFGSCAKGGGVSLLHGATDLLDDTIRAATQRNHVYFVDPRAAFTGHSECDKDAWINHVYGGELQVSFHPNDAGWSEDAQLIETLLWRIGW